ncbi:fluoride efflux transporter CrcB [Mesorhizobium shangrilense]|uniref:Fluoride-specific ion channel FluC n=1 Tax=Mesorhizobium shangrilense TaxID=460060 RepID=A0ABV2D749_9HYPH
MSFANCLLVMVGGALGTLARYLVSTWALPVSSQLPWGTIIINISGSLLIGFFGTLTLASGRYPAPESLRLFVMIGLCGGYTTFSSFSLQTLDLMRAGGFGRAALNIGLSVVLCVGAVALGHVIAARINGGAAQIAQVGTKEEA